jgi:signal transduction histidine kinase
MYAKYKFMYIFFKESKTNKKIEMSLYIGYLLVNSILFLIFKNPIVNLLNNIILLFALTFNYNSSWVKKMIAPVIIYAVSSGLENISYYILSFIIDDGATQILLSTVTSRIIFFFIVLLLNNLRNIKMSFRISITYIIIIFSTSIFSIYISTVLMLNFPANNTIHMILSISALLAINFFVIYIYDVLNDNYDKELEKKLLEQQNKSYFTQLDIMNQSQDNIKFLKHDIKKHFITLKTMLDNGQSVKQHINKFLESIDPLHEYAQSGNIMIDSILNYKLQEAQNKNTDIEVELKIPRELNVNPFDMGVILGNLLDNAIKAVSKINIDRKIKVSMYFDKNIIYINIINTFDGDIIFKRNKYETIKEDKYNHGLGLLSVKKTLEKYDGKIETSNTDFIFSAKVIMYNNINE